MHIAEWVAPLLLQVCQGSAGRGAMVDKSYLQVTNIKREVLRRMRISGLRRWMCENWRTTPARMNIVVTIADIHMLTHERPSRRRRYTRTDIEMRKSTQNAPYSSDSAKRMRS